MAVVTRECRITVDGRLADEPLLWRMSRALPAVVFDIRQATLPGSQGGVVTLRLEGEAEEVEDALEYLANQGVGLALPEQQCCVVGRVGGALG